MNLILSFSSPHSCYLYHLSSFGTHKIHQLVTSVYTICLRYVEFLCGKLCSKTTWFSLNKCVRCFKKINKLKNHPHTKKKIYIFQYTTVYSPIQKLEPSKIQLTHFQCFIQYICFGFFFLPTSFSVLFVSSKLLFIWCNFLYQYPVQFLIRCFS